MGVQLVDTPRTTGQAPSAASNGEPQWTDAILPYVSSGAHFMFDMRTLRNFTTAAVRAWGEQQFFGPSIDKWPQWSSVGGVGGWAGIAKLGRKIRIEVGSVRWRTEGWVSLRATAENATVQTVPVAVVIAGDSSSSNNNIRYCGRVGASINLRGSAVIEVLDADGNPAAGFSGLGAARLMDEDDVAAALLFGTGSNQTRVLPLGAGPTLSNAIAFRVTMARGAEVFGLSFRCV
eukprot:COSAG02_NODE_6991_length_3242_cov_9.629335_1_plen_233_part_00